MASAGALMARSWRRAPVPATATVAHAPGRDLASAAPRALPGWPAVHPALTDAAPRVFWTDRPDAPAPAPPLDGDAEADLCVVGGGFTGLWAALLACEQGADPASVVVLEGERVAFGASGRNGGFVAASLTHGLANGASRWPGEIDRLERLGAENLAGIEATLARESVACAWERDRGARRRGRAVAGRGPAGGRRAGAPARARGRAPRRRGGAGPRSAPPPSWPAGWTPRASRCATRPGWPGACGPRCSGAASASTSGRGRPR